MEKKSLEKVKYYFNHHLMGYDDYKELFKDIGLSKFENLEMKKARMTKEQHFSIITAIDSNSGNKKTILVYGILGQPTFKQMLEITYDQDSDIDVRIFLFDDHDGLSHGLMNNRNMAERFTDMLNDCHQNTYLVEIIEAENDDASVQYQYELIIGPESVRKSYLRRLPSKRDLQEGEIWIYYWDFLGIQEESIESTPNNWEACWPVKYVLHGIETFISWNDEGISIITYAHDNKEKEEEILENIYSSKSYELKAIFKGCKIHMKSIDIQGDEKFCLIIEEVDKRPISDLFEATAKKKYHAVEQLREYEMRFEKFINRYFAELKIKEITA